jgi:phosphopantothenoylcysteine synthetase/decarboxylase
MAEMTTSKEHHPVLVLGVTGSIAAYKAAEITSRAVKRGLDVHVIMTAAALELITARTFMTLSRNPVMTSLWETPRWQPAHIELAMQADALLIAPATADILAKMAHGIADDALSTYCLSHTGPVLVAPAMNPRMWANPATQENCRTLAERGVIFIGPEGGTVACGEEGVGRMSEPETILERLQEILFPKA